MLKMWQIMEGETIGKICVLMVLFVLSWIDIQRLAVPRKGLCVLGVLITVILTVRAIHLQGALSVVSVLQEMKIILLRTLIGILFLGISKVTENGLGFGDSYLILMLSVYLGAGRILELLAVAFGLALLCSMICISRRMLFKRYIGSDGVCIPFVPFLTIGYLGVWLAEGGIG